MRTEAQKRAGRAYYERNTDLVKAKAAARYVSGVLTPDVIRSRQLWYKHKLTEEALRIIWQAQGGCCYLCERELDICTAVIEHDHFCCPPTQSCDLCRRGLAHRKCNVAIGQLGDDPDLIQRVADNLRAANALLRGGDPKSCA